MHYVSKAPNSKSTWKHLRNIQEPDFHDVVWQFCAKFCTFVCVKLQMRRNRGDQSWKKREDPVTKKKRAGVRRQKQRECRIARKGIRICIKRGKNAV